MRSGAKRKETANKRRRVLGIRRENAKNPPKLNVRGKSKMERKMLAYDQVGTTRIKFQGRAPWSIQKQRQREKWQATHMLKDSTDSRPALSDRASRKDGSEKKKKKRDRSRVAVAAAAQASSDARRDAAAMA
mmetsp:Transcript_9989/g.21998  ORF Transcript_9989/g.21998 Transcript_9989/m.21998 type:complete len:132 (+) Transcript_9989:57-452(+)